MLGHRVCLEEKCSYEIFHLLRVPVRGEQLRIRSLDLNTLTSSSRLPQYEDPYDIFIAIGGHDDMPTFHGIGTIFNILVWQIHGDEVYDSYSSIEGTISEASLLGSYDWVLVTSRHNLARYSTAMLPLYKLSTSMKTILPTVSILHLPLDPSNEKSKNNKEITNIKDTSIINKINSNIGPPRIGSSYSGVTTIVAIGKFSPEVKYGRPHSQYLKMFSEISKVRIIIHDHHHYHIIQT